MVRWTIFMRYAMTSDRRRLLIAVTPEDICHGESGIVAGILDAGFDYVHLRHPAASLAEVKAVIEDIPHRLRRRLRLHGHFGLVHEFNLGGLHLNRRCPSPPCGYQGPVSRSCHSVAEVTEVAGECDYVTLSPIFPASASRATVLNSLRHRCRRCRRARWWRWVGLTAQGRFRSSHIRLADMLFSVPSGVHPIPWLRPLI